MNILLDTHIFLWWTLSDSRLPSELRHDLEAPGNIVFLSAASVWELCIKHGLGRIGLPANPAEWVRSYYQQYDIDPLPITYEHALAITQLPPKHKDPFDRMLVAQARVENMRLASLDQMIRQYDVPLLP